MHGLCNLNCMAFKYSSVANTWRRSMAIFSLGTCYNYTNLLCLELSMVMFVCFSFQSSGALEVTLWNVLNSLYLYDPWTHAHVLLSTRAKQCFYVRNLSIIWYFVWAVSQDRKQELDKQDELLTTKDDDMEVRSADARQKTLVSL